MTILFLISAAFCLYTFAVFPCVLHWRARSRAEQITPLPSPWPTVSVVIAAHNEAMNLPRKLETLKALDYPHDKLQIVIVSDGSSDDTVAILDSARQVYPQLVIHHYENPEGKPTALNAGVALADGEVLVFMDARQPVSRNAVRELVTELMQPGIGAVSGELELTSENGNDAVNVGLYWRYEKWIRNNESSLFSTTGATGALYAIHKDDYKPIPADTLLDDFEIPVRLLRQGLRTVVSQEAKVYDRAEANVDDEFRRKVRTLAGNYQSFARNAWLFNPARNPVFAQFISHKVFRLLVPYAMLLALLACIAGESLFLKVMLVAQVGFYVTGLLGFLGMNNNIGKFIKVFLKLNAAAVAGALRYLRGNVNVTWRQQ